MNRPLTLIALLVTIASLPPQAHAETAPAPKSVSIELPGDSSAFPDKPGVDFANGNCLACHSADMVLNQPALSKTEWKAEVEKMRTAYKAPIDPKDVDPIVDYLVSIRGAK